MKPKLDDIKTMKINIDPDCIETDDNNCTQATAFRFMPFKGSEGLTGRRGIVQPGSLIENTFDSTNTDAIKAELKKIFEPLKRGTRCSAFGMHWKNKGGWGVSRVNKLASFDIFVDQMKKKAAPAAADLRQARHGIGGGGAGRQHRVLSAVEPATAPCTGLPLHGKSTAKSALTMATPRAAAIRATCGGTVPAWRAVAVPPPVAAAAAAAAVSISRDCNPACTMRAGDEWDVLHVS